jgi:alkyl hydroperoxide reductase subunit AhpC
MAGVSLRATYIIDSKGVLRHMSLNDLPVGRDVKEVLRLVEAFQFSDKYGEVCPASWKPGKPTMEANPESKKTA